MRAVSDSCVVFNQQYSRYVSLFAAMWYVDCMNTFQWYVDCMNTFHSVDLRRSLNRCNC